MDNKPTRTDVSSDTRDWDELFPEVYFQADQLMGKELTLQIGSVLSELFPGDTRPNAVIKFANHPQMLKTTKDNRLVIKEAFGTSPTLSIGKWIKLSGYVNEMKRCLIRVTPLLGGPVVPQVAATQAATQQQPATLQNIPPDQLQQMLAALQAQQAQAQKTP